MMQRFRAAVEICGSELRDAILRAVHEWLPARAIVNRAYADRHNVDPTGRIMVMQQANPWEAEFFRIEAAAQRNKPTAASSQTALTTATNPSVFEPSCDKSIGSSSMRRPALC